MMRVARVLAHEFIKGGATNRVSAHETIFGVEFPGLWLESDDGTPTANNGRLYLLMQLFSDVHDAFPMMEIHTAAVSCCLQC